jgi:hypothetical protein
MLFWKLIIYTTYCLSRQCSIRFMKQLLQRNHGLRREKHFSYLSIVQELRTVQSGDFFGWPCQKNGTPAQIKIWLPSGLFHIFVVALHRLSHDRHEKRRTL